MDPGTKGPDQCTYFTSWADPTRSTMSACCASEGVIDCPAYDGFVAALQGRGWLPPKPDLEPNPDGEGKIGRWRLTDKGRDESAEFLR